MPNSDTTQLLSELEVTASRLNSAFDDLNVSLEKIQQRLNDSSIGLEVWVSMEHTRLCNPEADAAGYRQWSESQLGYARFGDGWALQTRGGRFESNDQGEEWTYDDPKPLTRSPRKLRVEAVRSLPALFAALQTEANRILELVKDAELLAQDDKAMSVSQDDNARPACLWCHAERTSARRLEMGQPRECPACDHVFRGKGWDGIDAHWKAEHERQYGLSYDEFWNGILRCVRHWR